MPRPSQTETQIAINLLTATGMKPLATVENLANAHPLNRIRQCVSHWYMHRSCVGGEFKDTPGIVLYWLLNWDISAVPEIHPNFYNTDLYLSHRTRAEKRQAKEQERQARAWVLSTQAPRPGPAVEPALGAPLEGLEGNPFQQAWHGVLTDLALTVPNADRILQNNLTVESVAVTPAGAHYLIAVTRANTLQRLQRLANLFAIRLAAQLKSKVDLTFTLAQASAERSPP